MGVVANFRSYKLNMSWRKLGNIEFHEKQRQKENIVSIFIFCQKATGGMVVIRPETFVESITRNWRGATFIRLKNSDFFTHFSRKFQFYVKFSN